MVSSNTESGITVAYQDADGTLDFTVGTLNQNTTGTAATVTGAAQTNITSVGTLTALDVDNINLNADTITGSGSTLNLTNNDIRFKTSGAETMLRAEANGSVELMYDNTTKIQTTSRWWYFYWCTYIWWY